jgi:clan AA aspartic protease
MISGVVTSSRHPIVRLVIQGPEGATNMIEAIVDTGFNGELTLPLASIDALRLAWSQSGRALLADGSEILFDSYEAVIEWDGAARPVTVDAAESEPLIGMALLDGYVLTVHAIAGGAVTITPLP